MRLGNPKQAPATHANAADGAAPMVYERAAAAFSAVSGIYDLETEPNPVVAWVRARTFGRLAAVFGPGDRVLELGCGTGVEALALAHCGVAVVATDVAPGMLAVTQEKVQQARLTGSVYVKQMAAGEIRSLIADYAPGSFAGVYSSFGALNCEPNLQAVADGLANLVRPGGRVMISAINRFHPFEFAWYGLHGDLRRATRRWGGYSEGTVSPTLPDRVPTYYYTPRGFAEAFAPSFRTVDCRALLLLLPPPYLAHLLTRYPRMFGAAALLESQLAAWPVLRALGDHFWLELERV